MNRTMTMWQSMWHFRRCVLLYTVETYVDKSNFLRRNKKKDTHFGNLWAHIRLTCHIWNSRLSLFLCPSTSHIFNKMWHKTTHEHFVLNNDTPPRMPLYVPLSAYVRQPEKKKTTRYCVHAYKCVCVCANTGILHNKQAHHWHRWHISY